MKIIAILLLLTGCGINVHVDPIESKPVQVIHTLNINFDSISNYCKQKCTLQSTDAPTIESCTSTCYANFLDLLVHGTQNLAPPLSTPSVK